MSKQGTAALLMSGLVALGVVSAPVATARPTCQETSTKTICQTSGSVSIKARPGTLAPPGNQVAIPWLGMPGARRR